MDNINHISNIETEIEVSKKLIKENELVNPTSQKCPYCGSTDLLEYLYGRIRDDYDRNKYINGGCGVSHNNPLYRCKKCGNDIFHNLNNLIKYNVGNDPFWEKKLIDFFDHLVNKNIEEKVTFLKNLVQNKELFNEFTKEIVKFVNADELFDKYNID